MAQSHSHTHSHSGRGRHAAAHENGAVTQERYQKLKRKVRDMENFFSNNFYNSNAILLVYYFNGHSKSYITYILYYG